MSNDPTNKAKRDTLDPNRERIFPMVCEYDVGGGKWVITTTAPDDKPGLVKNMYWSTTTELPTPSHLNKDVWGFNDTKTGTGFQCEIPATDAIVAQIIVTVEDGCMCRKKIPLNHADAMTYETTVKLRNDGGRWFQLGMGKA